MERGMRRRIGEPGERMTTSSASEMGARHFHDSRMSAAVRKQSSEEAEPMWERMLADSLAHLIQAQQVLEELAKGLVGPVNAVMSCVEACHSVAVAMVALADAAACPRTQDNVQMGMLRSAC
jgi:hypothetical protein